MEWGRGRYESLAEQLLPAAKLVVEEAAPGGGEHVIDVGCGTGSAGLLAAERGARVTGFDPAERLVGVANAQAADRGLDARFLVGDADTIAAPDASADAVISSFGVIFAPEAGDAIGEMTRVTAPEGRIVFSAWVPGGALGDSVRVRREAAAEAAGEEPGPPPFAWHDRDALAVAFGPHGFEVEVREEDLAFTAATAEEFMEIEFNDHPLWVEAREILGAEQAQETSARALEILEAGNEDPTAFRVTSRYVVVTARPA